VKKRSLYTSRSERLHLGERVTHVTVLTAYHLPSNTFKNVHLNLNVQTSTEPIVAKRQTWGDISDNLNCSPQETECVCSRRRLLFECREAGEMKGGVCSTLRSIISCSSCTMSSLRLSCRVDILCSSSSLRCLSEGDKSWGSDTRQTGANVCEHPWTPQNTAFISLGNRPITKCTFRCSRSKRCPE